MYCQKCHIRTASVIMTQIVNGVRTDLAFCQKCAVELGMDNPFTELPSEIAKLISQTAMEKEAELEQYPDIGCSGCGVRLRNFLESGLLGCPRCYDDFYEYLKTLLRRYHGTNRHLTARKRSGAQKPASVINKLEGELERALAVEDFEAAAKIRDKIKALKKT